MYGRGVYFCDPNGTTSADSLIPSIVYKRGFGTFASLIEPSTSYLHCFIRATGAHGGFPDERLALFSIILVVPNILPQTLGPPVTLTP